MLSTVANVDSNDNQSCKESQSKSVSNVEAPIKKRKKITYKWHTDKNQITSLIPEFEELRENSDDALETDPLKIFEEKFWTDEWIETLCEQSRIYAHQKSLPSTEVNSDNMRVFLAILILSGYNKVPNRRLYWSDSPDTQNTLVVNSMRRDTFDEIMRCFHCNDNMKMNNDRFYKVRPFFDHLYNANKSSEKKKYYSIDEVMVPYYGRHGDKQYIRGKPVRFGFKLWAITSSDGYLHHVEPYCGAHSKIVDRGFGVGGNVVLEMIEKTNLTAGQHVVFDNFFGSIALLEELASRKIAATCTLREDRLSGAPLKPRPVVQKMNRGTMEEVFTGCISVVKWKDNKVVSVGSNKLRTHPIEKAKKWNRVERRHTFVDLPHSIYIYNQHMGGVDVFDQQVAAYRCRIRSKKWWWSLFAWTINAQVVNGWKLCSKHKKSVY